MQKVVSTGGKRVLEREKRLFAAVSSEMDLGFRFDTREV